MSDCIHLTFLDKF